MPQKSFPGIFNLQSDDPIELSRSIGSRCRAFFKVGSITEMHVHIYIYICYPYRDTVQSVLSIKGERVGDILYRTYTKSGG